LFGQATEETWGTTQVVVFSVKQYIVFRWIVARAPFRNKMDEELKKKLVPAGLGLLAGVIFAAGLVTFVCKPRGGDRSGKSRCPFAK
jgi:hypothetical protein